MPKKLQQKMQEGPNTMHKGILFIVLSVVCIMAALVMYQVGSNSTHVSELKDYCLVPLPLGLVAFITGILHLRNK